MLLAAFAATAYVRVLSGLDNGCYYARGAGRRPPELVKYMDNIHNIETPYWYAHFGSTGIYVLIICSFLAPQQFFLWHIAESVLCTMGASAAANYKYQYFINIGSGLPGIDPNENPKSEFAFIFKGKSYSFWWSRPWYGERRRYVPVAGVVAVIAGLLLVLFV